MTPSPTEQEIVARAMLSADHQPPEMIFEPIIETRTKASIREQYLRRSKAAIHALDQFRSKNAGEVERECAEIIDRNKMYMDGFDGKNELVVGPLNLRWRVEEATDQLSKAANLISSMRAVIEESEVNA